MAPSRESIPQNFTKDRKDDNHNRKTADKTESKTDNRQNALVIRRTTKRDCKTTKERLQSDAAGSKKLEDKMLEKEMNKELKKITKKYKKLNKIAEKLMDTEEKARIKLANMNEELYSLAQKHAALKTAIEKLYPKKTGNKP